MIYRTALARLFFILVWIALTGLPVAAQDSPGDAFFRAPDGYYTVLVPAGWQMTQAEPYVSLSSDELNATITVISVTGVDMNAAVTAAVDQVFDQPVGQVDAVGEARLSNGLWVEYSYRLENDAIINAFAQPYTSDTYTVILYTVSPAIYALLMTASDTDTAVNSVFETLMLASESTLNTTTQLDNQAVLYEYEAGDEATMIWLQPVTGVSETYYVLASTNAALNPDHAIIFRVLDRFFATPETANYLLLGLVITVVLMTIMGVSFYLRYQNLKRDEALITELLNS